MRAFILSLMLAACSGAPAIPDGGTHDSGTPDAGRPCGGNPCGVCAPGSINRDVCNDGVWNCLCDPQPTTDGGRAGTSCGGFRPQPPQCASGLNCVDDPNSCPQANDCAGVCVAPGREWRDGGIPTAYRCGGFVGTPCPNSLTCVDDPNDSCDPSDGGADCPGICI